MPYPSTVVLQLPIKDTYASEPNDLAAKLAQDQQLSGALVAIDQWAASMTGSACYSMFCPYTGSVSDMNIGAAHPGAGVLGVEFNRSQHRVIQEVVVFATATGSSPTATVRVDVQVQPAPGAPYASIFSNSAFKPVLSGSANGGVGKSFTFVSGTNMPWQLGTLLKATVDQTANLGAGNLSISGVTCQVFWKPSGSYGA